MIVKPKIGDVYKCVPDYTNGMKQTSKWALIIAIRKSGQPVCDYEVLYLTSKDKYLDTNEGFVTFNFNNKKSYITMRAGLVHHKEFEQEGIYAGTVTQEQFDEIIKTKQRTYTTNSYGRIRH